jgi:hypothetical protein
MGRWPPLVWLLVSLGSLLVLIGIGMDDATPLGDTDQHSDAAA